VGYSLVGPFREWRVTVDSKRVPLLSAEEIDGGRINLVFDGKWCVLLDAGEAEAVVPFVAEIIRTCLDYKHAWPEMMEIGSVER
jgi:hypothetical protein